MLRVVEALLTKNLQTNMLAKLPISRANHTGHQFEIWNAKMFCTTL